MEGELQELRMRVATLEDQLRALQQFVGYDDRPAGPVAGAAVPSPTGAPAVPTQVRDFVAQGKQIQAIKELRAHWKIGLADAKRIVDEIADGRR